MVTAVSTMINAKTTPNHNNDSNNNNRTRRPPLLPSEPDNAIVLAGRRPKSREVTSRYMSSSSSASSTPKRSLSPLISRPKTVVTPVPSVTNTIRRSLSLESKRPNTARFDTKDLRTNGFGSEVSNAQKMLITATRSLSVSFQGESFSLQVSKAKPAVAPTPTRKGTPERRKATPTRGRGGDQLENSNSRLWPGRMRELNSLTRSVDFTDDNKRILTGSGVNVNVIRALQTSMVGNNDDFDNDINRCSAESRLRADSSNIEVNGTDSHCDHPVASDTESVSSGSTTDEGIVGNGGQAHRQRGIVVPARFWQETSNKLRRQLDPGSPVSRAVGGFKGSVPTKPIFAPKKIGIDSPVSSPKGVVNNRGQLSPIRAGALQPASPSKLGNSSTTLSPMRGVSPSRMRNSVGAVVDSNINNASNTPTILSFAADIRRSKSGEHQIVEVHLLRIWYNRLLQWRFINARSDTSLLAQKSNAEKSLYHAHLTTSKLRESVRAKRMELQCLRQNMKLISILKGQMISLEELAIIDQEYSRSVSGATEALRASTLRLPVVSGARADVQNVKDAICSALDVMQAMASSVCLLSSKVGEVNSLVVELAKVTAKESALLDQCKDLLSIIAAIQVKECSLRTHFIQTKTCTFQPNC